MHKCRPIESLSMKNGRQLANRRQSLEETITRHSIRKSIASRVWSRDRRLHEFRGKGRRRLGLGEIRVEASISVPK